MLSGGVIFACGAAIGSPPPVPARTLATAQQGARTGSERAKAGNQASSTATVARFERLAAENDQFVGRSMQAAALKFGLLVSDFRF
jgi:hypothetical protein